MDSIAYRHHVILTPMIEALIQPTVNIIGLAAITLVLCIVPVMLSAIIIRSLWWWGLGDVE